MRSMKKYLSFLLTLTLLFNLVTTYSFANQNNSFGKGKIKIDKIEEYSGSDITPFREQVPDNEWQLASDNEYNQSYVSVTVGVITGILLGWGFGWITSAPSFVKELITGLFGGLVGSSTTADLWARKRVFYRQNQNNNGYPYYCMEITDVSLEKEELGSYYKRRVVYFYSYQPY